MTPLGENAILGMVRLLSTVADLERPHDYLREPTANVGLVKGGTAPNVVASECEASIDIRFPPTYDFGAVRKSLDKRLGSAGVPYDVEVLQTLPAVGIDPNAPHIRALRRAGGGGFTVMTYASEMAVFHAVNPRMAILGPGEPTLAHTADEFVEWAEIPKAARIYASYGEALVRGRR